MLHTALTSDSELLTTSHVARELAVSEGTVRSMARRGELPCLRIASGLRLFNVKDVLRLRAERVLDGTR